MSDEGTTLAPISFTFEYAGHGWADASISDGEVTHYMSPSYLATDPLFELIRATVEVLRCEGEVRAGWLYEPGEDFWLLRREGDILHITILRLEDSLGLEYLNRLSSRAKSQFSTTCDVWKFAAKVRLAASRMIAQAEAEWEYDPASVLQTAEYRALCALLEEHKEERRRAKS